MIYIIVLINPILWYWFDKYSRINRYFLFRCIHVLIESIVLLWIRTHVLNNQYLKLGLYTCSYSFNTFAAVWFFVHIFAKTSICFILTCIRISTTSTVMKFLIHWRRKMFKLIEQLPVNIGILKRKSNSN